MTSGLRATNKTVKDRKNILIIVPRGTLATKIDEQDGNVGRRDSRNPGRLGDRPRIILLKFLTTLDGEAKDFVIIEIFGNYQLFKAREFIGY
jgi:hypothetical protein